MKEAETTKLVQQAYAKFKAGEIDALLGMLGDTIEWELPDIENVPFAGKRQGRANVGEFFLSVNREQEALEFEPTEFVASGDKVVTLGRYAWRVKRTGRTFGANWAHVFTIRDGRIVGFHEYTDTAVVAAAYR